MSKTILKLQLLTDGSVVQQSPETEPAAPLPSASRLRRQGAQVFEEEICEGGGRSRSFVRRFEIEIQVKPVSTSIPCKLELKSGSTTASGSSSGASANDSTSREQAGEEWMMVNPEASHESSDSHDETLLRLANLANLRQT